MCEILASMFVNVIKKIKLDECLNDYTCITFFHTLVITSEDEISIKQQLKNTNENMISC